jgi:hypothetical protein
MKPSKIFWGIFFLGLGVLLLIKNFGGYDFYIPEIRKLWPLLLIAAGVIYLTKNMIARNALAGLAGFALAFFILTITATIQYLPKKIFSHVNSSQARSELISLKTEPYDTTIKFVDLQFDGGAGKYIVTSKDTNLMTLRTDRSGRRFSIQNEISSGKADLNIEMAEFHFDTDDTTFAALIELNLNPKPFYENISFQIGAADLELNISDLLFRKLKLELGASSTKLFLPNAAVGGSEVRVECGASSIELIIKKDSQVKIVNSMALSDFRTPPGFTEKGEAIYSDNFTGSGDVITVYIDGGVSSLQLRRQ